MTSSSSIGLLSLLPILAGGYVILSAKICRHWTAWLPGRVLYFCIAIAGLLAFILAAMIESNVNLSSLQRIVGADILRLSSPFLFAWAVRIILDALFFAISKWNPQIPTRLVFDAIKGQEFERFIYKAITEQRLIMATLEAGKVYIGWPLDTFSFSDSDTGKKFLRLLPLQSGHRDEKQRYESTTAYSLAFAKIKEENPAITPAIIADKLQVVVPVRQIVSVHFYDMDIYKAFHPVSSAAALQGAAGN